MKEKFTLKQLRGIRGITKEELAKRSGVTARTIFLYENDIHTMRRGKYDTLEKIARALGVEVVDMLLDPTTEVPKKLI